MSSETCEFYVTNWDGPVQTLAGKVVLENGKKLRFIAKNGHGNFMKEIRAAETVVGNRLFDPVKDPEGWFKSLPFQYSGSMVRAQIVKTSRKKKKSLARKRGSRSRTKGIKGGKNK